MDSQKKPSLLTKIFHIFDPVIKSFFEAKDRSSFGVKQKIFLLKEIGFLINGGVGVVEAFETIHQDTKNFAIKDITAEIIEYLNQGKSLSFALTRQMQYFNTTDITIIKSGEKTGQLGNILHSLGKEYQFINTLKGDFVGALIYPAVLLVAGIGIILLLFVFVLPEIFGIVEQFPNIELPALTLFLKNMSEYIIGNWQYLGGGAIVLVLTISIIASTPWGSKLFFGLGLRTPVLGNVLKSYYLVKIGRYVQIMLNAGLNYLETFRLIKNIIGLPTYNDLFEDTLHNLNEGKTIHETFVYYPTLIPSVVTNLVKVGEKTSNVGNSFGNIVEVYEEELRNNTQNLSKVIEPVMLIFIGGVVVVIALGVFGVITQLMDIQ